MKQKLKAFGRFLASNSLPIVIVGGLLVWFWPEGDGLKPIPYATNGNYVNEESMEMAYDMADSVAAPRMAKMAFTRGIGGGGIVPQAMADGFDPESEDKKVVKNGSLNIEVEETEAGRALAEAEVSAVDGAVSHLNSWEVRTGVLAYSMTVRVPADKLEVLVENLAKLGVKKSENYSTSDITAQYNDTENQIKNLESRRDRLRKLMEFETESLSDVLQVDRELNQVQNQLDNYKRTQQRRDTDVAFSTLRLTINPEPTVGDFSNPDWNIERSWKTALNDFIASSQSIVDKAIRLLVYLPIWLPVLLILWWLKRRYIGTKTSKKK